MGSGQIAGLVLATANAGKVEEIRRIFSDLDVRISTPGELGLSWESPEEGEVSFLENAVLKARHLAELSGSPALADDSGLCVDALGGAPGVTSSRYGGEGLDDEGRYTLLLRELGDAEDRKAHFVCVAALCKPDGSCLTAEGEVEGVITEAPRGQGGFGYDPVFVPTGHEKTMAEFEPDEKASISHRGEAFRALRLLIS